MTKDDYKAIILRALDFAYINGLVSNGDYWAALDITQGRIPVSPEESREINEAVEIADEGGARR